MGPVNIRDLPQLKDSPKPHARKFGTLRIDGRSAPVFTKPNPNAASGKTTANVGGPLVTTPTHVFQSYTGTTNPTSSCGCQPPDSNGAVSGAFNVEAVNLALGIYLESNGALLSRTSLNAFFGTSASLSDPRIFFDATYRRWVLVMIPVPATTTSTPQLLLAVSMGSDPRGGWFRYTISFGGGLFPPGTLLDYPMVGMDADAVIIGSNNFRRTTTGFSYINSTVFSLPKQRSYNGWGFSFPAFAVDFATHPAFSAGIPMPNTGRSYLLSSLLAGYNLNYFDVYYMTNTSRTDSTALFFQGNTSGSGPTCCGRPTAPTQPGGGVLDALDGRLQAAPWQLGNTLWWARATGFPVIQYGFVDLTSLGVASAVAYQSGPSSDWNPSIGVTAGARFVFLNWVYVSPSANVTMRVSGLSNVDAVQNLIGVGTDVATGFHGSNTRFGDYSSVSIDPSAQGACGPQRSALVVNEIFAANSDWANRLARVGFC